MSKKIPITLTESLRRELDRDSEISSKPVAAIIRDILTDHYNKQGRHVDKRVNWGGYRERRISQAE